MTDWIGERAREMRQIIAEIDALRRELTQEQLGWRPRGDQWSIGQIMDHLVLTDRPALEPISKLVATAPRGDAPWKPTIMGRLILMAVEPKTRRKTKAKKGFLPAEQPAGEVIEEYLEVRQRLLELLSQSAGADLNRVKTDYPIRTPFRYNLGDAFLILIRHTERHLQQIHRLRGLPGFPPPVSPR